jgi:cold shock protein
MIGTVKWFNAANGYGFITPDDGSDDCFVHVTALQACGLKQLVEDQRVQYDMQEGRNGRMVACDLSILQNDMSQAAE